jgi:hypothetical protein
MGTLLFLLAFSSLWIFWNRLFQSEMSIEISVALCTAKLWADQELCWACLLCLCLVQFWIFVTGTVIFTATTDPHRSCNSFQAHFVIEIQILEVLVHYLSHVSPHSMQEYKTWWPTISMKAWPSHAPLVYWFQELGLFVGLMMWPWLAM